MDIQTIAVTVAEAVQAAPERAQELIAHPREAVEAITGAGGFDVTEVVQASCLAEGWAASLEGLAACLADDSEVGLIGIIHSQLAARSSQLAGRSWSWKPKALANAVHKKACGDAEGVGASLILRNENRKRDVAWRGNALGLDGCVMLPGKRYVRFGHQGICACGKGKPERAVCGLKRVDGLGTTDAPDGQALPAGSVERVERRCGLCRPEDDVEREVAGVQKPDRMHLSP